VVALELLILWPGLQELVGSALPAVDGYELDITSSETPSKPEGTAFTVSSLPADSAGWSVAQKLILFGVIVGGVAIYMRTRKGRVVGEKSLA
jgi:hypothetical protein